MVLTRAPRSRDGIRQCTDKVKAVEAADDDLYAADPYLQALNTIMVELNLKGAIPRDTIISEAIANGMCTLDYLKDMRDKRSRCFTHGSFTPNDTEQQELDVEMYM